MHAVNHRSGRGGRVLGAGPAGLTAAHELARRGERVVVLEAGDTVGGLARTVERDGFRFDLGGHRFFTKSGEVAALWEDLLADDLLVRPRLSRIYWRGRYIAYPLRAGDVVRRIGPVELTRSVASYLRAAPARRRRADSFDEWVTARFGRRLFELFFKSYTEKVWGVDTSELRAEWAAQRIRGLSLRARRGPGSRGATAAAGQEPDRGVPLPAAGARSDVGGARAPRGRLGGEVRLGEPVRALHRDGRDVVAVETPSGRTATSAVISSIPLRSAVAATRPSAPRAVRDAAAGLRYRDFLTVALVLRGDAPFPDNWIYVHDPEVRVGRIQNYRAWSPWMSPDPSTLCVGLEYFCFEDDELWTRSDADLVALARDELAQLGLGAAEHVVGGHVVRVPKAYPIYDASYATRLARIRAWLDDIPNLQQIGRNGLHRYNNSDHSMLTALRAVENLSTAPATTSGRSTPTAPTTSSGRARRAALPARARDPGDGGAAGRGRRARLA